MLLKSQSCVTEHGDKAGRQVVDQLKSLLIDGLHKYNKKMGDLLENNVIICSYNCALL